MAKPALIAIALSLVAVALLSSTLWGGAEPGQPDKGAEFVGLEKYKLVVGEIERRAEVDLGDRRERTYTVEMNGAVETPPETDVVAVFRRFRIASAYDDNKESVLLPPTRTRGRYRDDDYSPVHENVACFELARTELRRDAFTIRRMKLESQAIIAVKRKEHVLPAVVMEEFQQLGPGLKIRITELRMSDDRRLSVEGQYIRTRAGWRQPFVEQVFCLDEEGETIGGGRWVKGGPFGLKGRLNWDFQLRGTQIHRDIKIVTIVEAKDQKLHFDVTDVFQQ